MVDLDALKRVPVLDEAPRRVVSLVPSITETLFALGFGGSVVGATDFCRYPADVLKAVPRVGGPKDANVSAIVDLSPELVFVGQEESSPDLVEEMLAAGLKVWMFFPQDVEQAMDVMRAFLGIYHTDRPAMQINGLQAAVDYARAAAESENRTRYFCPIWQEKHEGQTYWMTFNDKTFTGDLLSVVGGENVFAERERRYPLAVDLGLEEAEEVGERDLRYPQVTVEEVVEADPELILLPSEPFEFNEGHKREMLDLLHGTTAVKNNRVMFVDGTLVTWYGARIGKALQELPVYFR